MTGLHQLLVLLLFGVAHALPNPPDPPNPFHASGHDRSGAWRPPWRATRADGTVVRGVISLAHVCLVPRLTLGAFRALQAPPAWARTPPPSTTTAPVCVALAGGVNGTRGGNPLTIDFYIGAQTRSQLPCPPMRPWFLPSSWLAPSSRPASKMCAGGAATLTGRTSTMARSTTPGRLT